MAQVEKNLTPLNDILQKHGVAIAELEKLDTLSGPPRQKAIEALAGKVTDRRGFAADIMAFQHKAMTKGAKVKEAQSTIKSVTINGDEATAVVFASLEGMQGLEVPMKLKRTKSGWKIDNTQFCRP